MTKKQTTFAFAASGQTCLCGRCGAPCKVDPIPESQARMLKRSDTPKGLCVNCAAHDWLRNTYPINLMLARAGPLGLALPHIQFQFTNLMMMANSDARPQEISWGAVIANWNLPFPEKMKPTARNPVTQDDLDRERAEGEQQQVEGSKFRLTERERRAKEMGGRNHARRASDQDEDPKAFGDSEDEVEK